MTLNMDNTLCLIGELVISACLLIRRKYFYFRFMTLLLSSSLVARLISGLTFLAAWILSFRSNNDREKTAPFECGFDPKNSARIPFSLRFFLLGIIFIVFDIEIVLIIPLPLIWRLINSYLPLLIAFLFLIILTLGLIHEWHEGSLNWSS